MTDIRDRIRHIIAEQAMLDVDQVTDNSSPADLGIDSLGLVEIDFRAGGGVRHHHSLQCQRAREIGI